MGFIMGRTTSLGLHLLLLRFISFSGAQLNPFCIFTDLIVNLPCLTHRALWYKLTDPYHPRVPLADVKVPVGGGKYAA